MTTKRKAQEAFGQPPGQLSAFAAAKLAKHSASSSVAHLLDPDELPEEVPSAATVGTEVYDGYHSGASSPDSGFVEDENDTDPYRPTGPKKLSTWSPGQDNVVHDDDDMLEIKLDTDGTVTFVGEYDVQITSGVVTIYAAILRSNSPPRRVYAPSTHALPRIQARQDNTIVRILSVRSSLHKLEKLSPLFRNIWTPPGERSFTFLATPADDRLQRSALHTIITLTPSQRALQSLGVKAASEAPRIMTIGSKSSGKSTFNRELCNHILSTLPAGKKCLYLDLDPGQPEFGPPGQLSLVKFGTPLLGPPFTHPAAAQSEDFRLIRSHTVAATSFKDDPELYKACAADLIRHADRKQTLIVNTCGWVTGVGASVLVDLASILSITDIVASAPFGDQLESLPFPRDTISYHRISPLTRMSSPRTPAQSRAMQTMAYFHHRPGVSDGAHKWSGKPIGQMRPWTVSYAGDNPGILAVMSYGQSPNPEFLAEVLDGSIVAVVALDDDGITIEDALNSSVTVEDIPQCLNQTPESIPYIAPDYQGLSHTLEPSKSHCIGLALIRGIDTTQKELHLVLPLPDSQIAALKQVVLVRGGFDAPEWAYLEGLYKNGENGLTGADEHERPWVSSKEMIGIESAVWRLRHPPLIRAGDNTVQ